VATAYYRGYDWNGCWCVTYLRTGVSRALQPSCYLHPFPPRPSSPPSRTMRTPYSMRRLSFCWTSTPRPLPRVGATPSQLFPLPSPAHSSSSVGRVNTNASVAIDIAPLAYSRRHPHTHTSRGRTPTFLSLFSSVLPLVMKQYLANISTHTSPPKLPPAFRLQPLSLPNLFASSSPIPYGRPHRLPPLTISSPFTTHVSVLELLW